MTPKAIEGGGVCGDSSKYGRKGPVRETPVGEAGAAEDPEKQQVGVERKKGT